jgi:hypothetical protein
MPTPAHRTHQATAWDRAAVTVLGGAGCALSYDALQQMATAVHVRHPLTFLFPVVIDGFIAYGVRALLVLRAAPFRARLYVWTLFATATAASIWANALHAVRLNQQTPTATGPHLGDPTVGALSTLAPLALAGATHLHILITRQSTPTTPPPAVTPPAPTGHEQRPTPRPRPTAPPEPGPEHEKPTEPAPTEPAPARRIGRPPSAGLDTLIDLVRPLFTPHESPTRATVRDHVHAAGHTLSEDRLTHVMNVLRRERPHP